MKNLAKNFLSNALYQIFTIIFPLLTMPYIARVLGAEQLGIYNYTYAIAIYFAMFVKLGADHYGNRSIAKVGTDLNKRSEVFWEIFGVQFLNGIFCTLTYLLFIFLFIKNNQKIAYLQVFLIISYSLDINWFFYGVEQFNIVILRNTMVKIFTIICVFLFVKNIGDVWIYTVIINAGSIIGFLVTWVQLKSYVRFNYIFKCMSLKKIFSHLRPTFVLFIPIISASIFTSFTTILLGQITNMKNVGFYDAGSKVLSMPKSVIAALGTVMLPKMAAAYENEKSKKLANEYLDISIVFVSFLSIVFTFGLLSISNEFILLFYGNGYLKSISVLNFLVIYLPFYALGNVIRTQYLIPQSKDRPFVISVLLGAIASVIVNLILIRPLGVVGASLGTVASEVVLALYQIFAARKEIDLKKFIGPLILFFAAGLTMWGLLNVIPLAIHSAMIKIILRIIIGAVIYLAICGFYFIYSKNSTIKLIRHALLKNSTKKISNLGK